MSSNIDATVPAFGNATTAGVRANFAAAKEEIDTLQTARAIRVQHVSEGLEVFQQIPTSNVQSLILFNQLLFNNGGLFNYDAPTGEIEFLEPGYYSVMVNFQAVRKLTGADADFGIHAELKPPSAAFTDFAGSARIVTLPGSVALRKDFRAYTVLTQIPAAGYKVRWMQTTTDASRQIGIVTYPAASDRPGAAGIVFSMWKVGKEL